MFVVEIFEGLKYTFLLTKRQLFMENERETFEIHGRETETRSFEWNFANNKCRIIYVRQCTCHRFPRVTVHTFEPRFIVLHSPLLSVFTYVHAVFPRVACRRPTPRATRNHAKPAKLLRKNRRGCPRGRHPRRATRKRWEITGGLRQLASLFT